MHAAPTTTKHTSPFPGSFNFIYFQPSLNTKCKVPLMRAYKKIYRLTCPCCPYYNESHQGSSQFIQLHLFATLPKHKVQGVAHV